MERVKIFPNREIIIKETIQYFSEMGFSIFSSNGQKLVRVEGIVGVFHTPDKPEEKKLVVLNINELPTIKVLSAIFKTLPEEIEEFKELYNNPETQAVIEETVLCELPTSILAIGKGSSNEAGSILLIPKAMSPKAALYELWETATERNFSIQ